MVLELRGIISRSRDLNEKDNLSAECSIVGNTERRLTYELREVLKRLFSSRCRDRAGVGVEVDGEVGEFGHLKVRTKPEDQ
jgi:hypothetical protein